MIKGISRGQLRLIISALALLLAVSSLLASFSLYRTTLAKIATIEDRITTITSIQNQKELQAAETLLAQQRALKQAEENAQTAKKESNAIQNTLSSLAASISKSTETSDNTVITSNDIAKYVDGVVQVLCVQPNGTISSGSGSLFKLPSLSYAVLTNKHVVENAKRCVASISDKNFKTLGIYALPESIFTYNKNTDTAILEIKAAVSTSPALLASLNYSLSTLRKCPSAIPIGSPTVIIGFPSYAKRDTETTLETIGSVKTIYRTVTNGIISGYDSSQGKPTGLLTDPNFFISAKIDSGNSGGLALAKDSSGLCILGLPTWLTIGSYETQGLVQNIRNILPYAN